jgi:hypothetical protein
LDLKKGLEQRIWSREEEPECYIYLWIMQTWKGCFEFEGHDNVRLMVTFRFDGPGYASALG